ncbi:hypothetical protein O6H91_16G085900 [Diphasiastrum complanatum]|uniref:Uncharacterized protein n=1 Tax=Diphasiastrum complanatum TaxID=34168 RepID=A0ACC2BEB2_DIPCM|nr:hypothetical protein O6H91_16G085900 [Diphasiastrum complanatum]
MMRLHYSMLICPRGCPDWKNHMLKNFVTIDWLQQAVDFLRSSHAIVLSLVERLQGEEWIIAYMDKMVNLLDVCDALKKGVSRLEEYDDLVEVVVKLCNRALAAQRS